MTKLYKVVRAWEKVGKEKKKEAETQNERKPDVSIPALFYACVPAIVTYTFT